MFVCLHVRICGSVHACWWVGVYACASVWFFRARMCFAHSRAIFIHAVIATAPSVSFSHGSGRAKRFEKKMVSFLFLGRRGGLGFRISCWNRSPVSKGEFQDPELGSFREGLNLTGYYSTSSFTRLLAKRRLVLPHTENMHIESLCHTLLLCSHPFSLWHPSRSSMFCSHH